MKDYYDILEVPPDASPNDIKKSFREKSKQHHPDKNYGSKSSEEIFKEISEAYEVLSDEKKRREYDIMKNNGGRMPFPGFENSMGGFANNIFNEFFRDMNPFGSPFEQHHGEIGNKPIGVAINLSFEDSFFGTKKILNLHNCRVSCENCGGTGSQDRKKHLCKKCNGVGKIIKRQQNGMFSFSSVEDCNECHGVGSDLTNNEICLACIGHGAANGSKEIEIDLPPGLNVGNSILFKEKGNYNKNGTCGDLIVQIGNIINNTSFFRIDNHLATIIKFDISQFICDDFVKVKHLDGNSRTKRVYCLDSEFIVFEGDGFKSQNAPPGNFLVKFSIDLPKNLSSEEKELIKNILKK